MHLTEAERKVMDVVWRDEKITAKDLAAALRESTQWSKTTSYTMISRCVEKGYLLREAPRYTCSALISKDEVSRMETDELLTNNFGGSADLLVASLVEQKKLSLKEIEKLYRLLQGMENTPE